jgi:cysteine-S-conjugate beta-lyase
MTFDFDHAPDRRRTNSVKWTYYPEDVLPLWVADMDFQSPPPIIAALRAATEDGVFGYELPRQALRESVAARMDQLYDWKVNPSAVITTPGIVSAFNIAAHTLNGAGNPGQGVLLQPPVYTPFLEVAKNVGLVNQPAPLARVEDSAQRFHYEIDFDAFEKTVHSNETKTGIFLLCNPHNPTGQAYTQEELGAMAEICLKNDLIICSDEIHSELLLGPSTALRSPDSAGGFAAPSHIPIATLSPEIEARTITLVAPSKTFNTAGLLCGFAIIPDLALREAFRKQSERLVHHISSLSLVAAQAAFSGACDDWLAELLPYLTANRDFSIEYVQKELPGIRTAVPDATYLLWLDCNELVQAGKIPGSPFGFFMKEAKVAFSDGALFGPGGENFVRLNFGCPRSTLEEALGRMKKALG